MKAWKSETNIFFNFLENKNIFTAVFGFFDVFPVKYIYIYFKNS